MYANEIDIETAIFNKLKEYVEAKSHYSPKVFNKAPRQLAYFPVVIFKESNNSEDSRYKTLDFSQTVNQITFSVEVYTQDITIGNTKYASKVVMSELKKIIFDFFQYMGFVRTSGEYTDSYGNDYDRYLMTYQTSQTSWNLKVM